MDFKYHIVANLGEDRNQVGSLKVYAPNGKLVFGPVPALGRGTNHQFNGFDHTKQLKRNADTPSGVARTQVIGSGASVDAFGPTQRIHLYKGISGNFLEAEKAGRSEILIHGGKQRSKRDQSWYPLHPTHGCIRLTNEDMVGLMKVINALGSQGKITIN